MRLAGAYRSLARPSSALEPSHPLAGVKQHLCPTKLSERLVAKLVQDISGLHPLRGRCGLRPSTPSCPQRVHFRFEFRF